MNASLRALLLAAIFAARIPTGALATETGSAAATEPLPDGLYAIWHTARGDITARIFFRDTPLTAASFVGLAEGTMPFEAKTRARGKPFYDGLTFHRVVPGFVAQGGDPLGTGEGDAGYMFSDEFSPRLKHDAAGTLAMANSGPNTNSSQFYFTLAPVNRLDYKHTVFGRVVRGMEALIAIEQGDVMERVEIVRIGAEAGAFRPDAAMFAQLRERTPAVKSRDPDLPPLFLDEARLSLRNGYSSWINEKLHHHAAVTGAAIRVRLLPALPSPPSGEARFNPLRALHQQLAGDDTRAATIIFLADEQRWRLWLGDGLLERFKLTVPSHGEDPGASALHNLKQAILAETKQLWENPEEPRHRAVDAAVTNLINALDRAAAGAP
ncbi:MAG: peptidylprolyl isomerase [Opitutaceae bacterium]